MKKNGNASKSRKRGRAPAGAPLPSSPSPAPPRLSASVSLRPHLGSVTVIFNSAPQSSVFDWEEEPSLLASDAGTTGDLGDFLAGEDDLFLPRQQEEELFTQEPSLFVSDLEEEKRSDDTNDADYVYGEDPLTKKRRRVAISGRRHEPLCPLDTVFDAEETSLMVAATPPLFLDEPVEERSPFDMAVARASALILAYVLRRGRPVHPPVRALFLGPLEEGEEEGEDVSDPVQFQIVMQQYCGLLDEYVSMVPPHRLNHSLAPLPTIVVSLEMLQSRLEQEGGEEDAPIPDLLVRQLLLGCSVGHCPRDMIGALFESGAIWRGFALDYMDAVHELLRIMRTIHAYQTYLDWLDLSETPLLEAPLGQRIEARSAYMFNDTETQRPLSNIALTWTRFFHAEGLVANKEDYLTRLATAWGLGRREEDA